MFNVLTSNIPLLRLERKTQLNVFRPTLSLTGFVGRLLRDLLSLRCGPVSFFGGLGLGHVLAFLGRAVKTRAFPVVNMCLRVHPYQAVPSAGCRGISCCLGASALCGGAGRGYRTRCRRTFRLEQIAKREFAR